MEDRYGSASLEDIQAFSRAFAAAMEAHLGEQRAGEIETEVSSVVRPPRRCAPRPHAFFPPARACSVLLASAHRACNRLTSAASVAPGGSS